VDFKRLLELVESKVFHLPIVAGVKRQAVSGTCCAASAVLLLLLLTPTVTSPPLDLLISQVMVAYLTTPLWLRDLLLDVAGG
jgi:hypothetical protein